MNTTSTKNPSWWNDKHASAWDRVKDAFSRDWSQTKADFSKEKGKELDQNVADTVKQASGKDAIPPASTPNLKMNAKKNGATDAYSDVKMDYNDAEPALRYGYGASSQFADHKDWDDKLETKLRGDWDMLKSGQAWDDAKSYVRSGFDRARKQH